MKFRRTITIVIILCGVASAQTDSVVLASAKKYGCDMINWYFKKTTKIGHGGTDYANAGSHYGACIFSETTKDSTFFNTVRKRYKAYMHAGTKPSMGHVDDNVHGIQPLELARQCGDDKFLNAGLKLADDEFSPSNPDNLRPDSLSTYSRFWVDDMFMIGALQVLAYRAAKNEKYINNAARTLVRYNDSIQLKSGNLEGLYYHRLPKSKFVWGRGNGWAAVGMTEVLLSLPQNNPYYAKIMKSYKAQMKALLKFQDPDGMWHQLIDEPKSYKETSSTGMFVFAMASGVHNGWLAEDSYKNAVKKGWMKLSEYFTSDGLKNVCVATWDFHTKQEYLDRPMKTGDPHGTAGFIWAATAMTRWLSNPPVSIIDKSLYPLQIRTSFGYDYRMFNLMGRSISGKVLSPDAHGIDRQARGVYVRHGWRLLDVDGR